MSGSDPHLVQLKYRATPLRSGVASPAELLNQRHYQTTLPAKTQLSLQQRQSKLVMEEQKQRTAVRFDKQAITYRELNLHEPVHVQLNPEVPRWSRLQSRSVHVAMKFSYPQANALCATAVTCELTKVTLRKLQQTVVLRPIPASTNRKQTIPPVLQNLRGGPPGRNKLPVI